MKKVTLTLAAISLFAGAYAQNLDRSIRPQPGVAKEIQLKDAKSFTLPNGLKVFVVENNKIPTVSYSIVLNIEPIEDPNKAGMSDFIGSLITSGTKTLSKEQFDEQVDMIGANISASSGAIYGTSMTKHQTKLLKLMSDALMNADFKQSEFDKLKKQMESGLESSKNEPEAMLSNVKGVINYGKNHNYGHVTTPTTLGNVTLEDCKKYYSTYFRPNVGYMAVVGDITFEEAKKLVTQYFGGWKKGTVPVNKYPKANYPTSTQIKYVPREGSVQSVIGITYPVDLYPGSQDVIKARLLNQILGGSSQGRLFLNLREAHGWTYGSYSTLSNNNIVGEFQAFAKARNAVTDSSVNEMLNEMNRLTTEKVSDEELQNMKNYIAGNFAIGLESPQTIATYAINQAIYNMPKDYYKNYLKNLYAVSSNDLLATAKKYIKPENANIIVVGSADEAPKLARFDKDGVIEYFDNYGNPIEAPAPKKTVSADVTGQTIKDAYIKAIGGVDAIADVKTLVVESEMAMGPQKINLTNTVVAPDKMAMSVSIPGMGEMQKVVVNGNEGYMVVQGNRQAASKDMVEDLKEQANIHKLIKDRSLNTDKVTGIEKVDGVDCYVVEESEKTATKGKTINYYEVASGLLVKSIVTDEATGSASTTTLSNYKVVEGSKGYKIPFKTVVSTPQGNQEINVIKATANTKVADSVFK